MGLSLRLACCGGMRGVILCAFLLGFLLGFLPGLRAEEKPEVQESPITFAKQTVDCKSARSAEPLFTLAPSGHDTVLLSFEFELKNGKPRSVLPSCGCAELVDMSIDGEKVGLLVNLSIPIEDGVQSVVYHFLNESKEVIFSQPVSVFKGRAKCIAGRMDLTLSELKKGGAVEIPFLLLDGDKKEGEVSALVNQGDKSMAATVTRSPANQGVFKVKFLPDDPKTGVIWITLKRGAEEFKNPLLVLP